MKKMLKRADGSKSQRGLWDNIRAKAAANKKAGKKGKAPSKDMLEQEAKIKAKMKMGGDWMQESKELKFGGPSKRKKYQTAPPPEEDIKLPTDVKYTKFTVTPTIEADKPVERKDNFITRATDKISDKFSTTAGGGNKGGGSTAFNRSCLSGDCIDMMKSKGGDPTNRQNPGGAPGLSNSKQLERGRVVHQTADEKMAGLENQAKYKAEAEARMAKKKADRDARAAASAPAEVQYDYKQVYAIDPNAPFDPNAKQKTGGKRKYVKKY